MGLSAGTKFIKSDKMTTHSAIHEMGYIEPYSQYAESLLHRSHNRLTDNDLIALMWFSAGKLGSLDRVDIFTDLKQYWCEHNDTLVPRNHELHINYQLTTADATYLGCQVFKSINILHPKVRQFVDSSDCTIIDIHDNHIKYLNPLNDTIHDNDCGDFRPLIFYKCTTKIPGHEHLAPKVHNQIEFYTDYQSYWYNIGKCGPELTVNDAEYLASGHVDKHDFMLN